jgi:hypothetical protein
LSSKDFGTSGPKRTPKRTPVFYSVRIRRNGL